MRLNLSRPIAFIDLETTGISSVSDRIVEVSVLKVNPDGSEDFHRKRVNPGVPIPPDATAVHGITDADVAGEPPFAAYAPSLNQFLAGCDLAGFNVAGFDLLVLEAEFQRAGVAFSREGRAVVDAMRIFHEKEHAVQRRDLEGAVQFYCGRTFPKGHSSEEDVRATAEVLEAQLARYADLPKDVQTLHDFCHPPDWIDPDGKLRWAGGVLVITFGKHRGRSLHELVVAEPDYLEWMLGQDFTPEVKRIITDALAGQFPTAPSALP